MSWMWAGKKEQTRKMDGPLTTISQTAQLNPTQRQSLCLTQPNQRISQIAFLFAVKNIDGTLYRVHHSTSVRYQLARGRKSNSKIAFDEESILSNLSYITSTIVIKYEQLNSRDTRTWKWKLWEKKTYKFAHMNPTLMTFYENTSDIHANIRAETVKIQWFSKYKARKE